MITIDIKDPTIEEFFKVECKNDTKKFIENITQFIKNYKIKQSIKQGLSEIKEIKSGKIQKRELEDILDEL